MSTGTAEPVATSGASDPPTPWWARSPGWIFHGFVVAAGLLILWTFSTPGLPFLLAMVLPTVLLVLGAVWFVRLILSVVKRAPGRRRYLVAPAIGLVVLGLVAVNAPLKARWAAGQSAFDRTIAQLPPPSGVDGNEELELPDRLGTYDLTGGFRTDDGVVVIYEATGDFMDDAGFVHVPEGGDVEELAGPLMESPRFRHLSGRWYAFTASW